MCLLLFKPADKIVADKHLITASSNNPHGAGIAIATGDKIIIEKSPTWGAEEIIKVLAKYPGHPALVHFRYATHGSKTEQNTHPFTLNENWVAAHNGIIHNVKTLPDESDTRAFLRINVIPMLEHGWTLTQEDVIQLLSQEMGTSNKMVFLNKEGVHSIANEQQGHWNDGIWYSNDGYQQCNYYGYPDYDDDAEWSAYKGKYGSTTYFPSQKSNTIRRYDSFGRLIADEPKLLTYPDKKNSYNEKWHAMNNLEVVCDCCREEIWGEYMYEAENKMVICKSCTQFLPASLELPKFSTNEEGEENMTVEHFQKTMQ